MATLINRKRQRLSSDNATVSFDHTSTPTTAINSSNSTTTNSNNNNNINSNNNNNQELNVTLNTSTSLNDGFNSNNISNTRNNNQSWHFTKAFNNQDTIQLKNNFTSQITEYDIIDLDSDSDEYVFKELNEETDNITTTVKEILDNGRQKKYNNKNNNNNSNHHHHHENNNNNLFLSSSSSSDGFDADNDEDNETELYSYSSSLSSHSNQLNSNNVNFSYQSSSYGSNNFNSNNDINNSHNSIFTFSDNNNVIPSLNNHNTPPHLLSNFNSSINFSSLSNNNNSNFNNNGIPKNAYNQNKKRTKSLPQLEYSKIGYKSSLNKNSVKQKIGEVKTPVIPYNQNFNYTYDSTCNIGSKNLRRASFITDRPSKNTTANNNNNLIDLSNNDNNANSESIQCDDDDGHYIIKVGSKFANNRFEIQALLGQGTFGKVIRAYDNFNNKNVAIKIIRNIPKYRDASRIELRVLSMIRKHDPKNINQCIHLRESLDYRGHICIVTDVLKISLFDFLKKNNYIQFPGSHIQAIAKQLLRSVAFLHDLNLIHTDLKPENILLENDKYAKRPYKNIISKKNYYRKVLIDPKVYTIDFGSAIFQDEYHSSVVSTRHYRAPEIILGIGWSFPCDMWSIGCILVELVTGDALFKTHDNLQHLAMIEKVTGQDIDIKLVTQCIKKYGSTATSASSGSSTYSRRSSNSSSFETIAESFSRSTGKLIFPNSDTPDNLINEVNELGILSDIIGLNVGFNFDMKLNLNESITKFNIKKSDRDCYTFWFYFLDLVKKLLIQDSRKRITASKAICHEWFDCGIYDDGTL
ncbi:hypothetical protein B5S28_g3204 [[Candida] boidinii]|nr:hypothetical protein B5S28_g3204 [[Candida] boidinii]OWB79335.1 hypothetical protein B5S32_g3554 [[Candida] boidinii]